MPRTCTVCRSAEAHLINVALVSREPYRHIAAQYGVSTGALRRHAQEHIPKLLVQAREAVEQTRADDLQHHMKVLQGKTLQILSDAEATGELHLALRAIREARGN